ncbi:MAG: hypothetical protein OEO84_08195 [Betaproteobacteria bacterium]|nr:hypothetical protein [Betaproteobacteria bacterium]MDH5537162.1 hypothetical protein [Betaproteobacteria bacterium]
MRWPLTRPQWTILYVLLAAALTGLTVAFFARSLMDRAAAVTEPTAFDQPPVFIGLHTMAGAAGLKPFALALNEKRLLVSYLSTDRVDEFSDRLVFKRTLHLLQNEPASITGVAVEGDRIYAADFKSGNLLVADYKTGKLVQSYGWLPGYKTRMKALGVAYHENNLYVSDVASGKMLAIGASAQKDVREEGELIVGFPNGRPEEFELGYPTWSMVTADGRLLVSDAKSGEVKAFTCSGRSAHLFDRAGEATLKTPMGIAMDDLPSPELLARKAAVFDPSRVNDQGRIHVVDATQARVKVFDALGKYVLTYGEELRQPNGIAIDPKRRLIFISDAQLRAIALYKY